MYISFKHIITIFTCIIFLLSSVIVRNTRTPRNLDAKENNDISIYSCQKYDTNHLLKQQLHMKYINYNLKRAYDWETHSTIEANFYIKRLTNQIAKHWKKMNCIDNCQSDEHKKIEFSIYHVPESIYNDKYYRNIIISALPVIKQNNKYRKNTLNMFNSAETSVKLIPTEEWSAIFQKIAVGKRLNFTRFLIVPLNESFPFCNKKVMFTTIGLSPKRANIIKSYAINILYRIEELLLESANEMKYPYKSTPLSWVLQVFRFSMRCMVVNVPKNCRFIYVRPEKFEDYVTIGDVDIFNFYIAGVKTNDGDETIEIAHKNVHVLLKDFVVKKGIK